MSAVIEETDKTTDLESNNLFIVPVTFKLLSTENRAMEDIHFAFDKHIPVLPLMMESGIGILPAEMAQTDKSVLAEKYVNPHDDDSFRNQLAELGRFDEAIKFYNKAYEVKVNAIGGKDESTLKSLIRLGMTYSEANNIPKAVECYEKTYSVRLEMLGAEHKDTVAVKKMLDELK